MKAGTVAFILVMTAMALVFAPFILFYGLLVYHYCREWAKPTGNPYYLMTKEPLLFGDETELPGGRRENHPMTGRDLTPFLYPAKDHHEDEGITVTVEDGPEFIPFDEAEELWEKERPRKRKS